MILISSTRLENNDFEPTWSNQKLCFVINMKLRISIGLHWRANCEVNFQKLDIQAPKVFCINLKFVAANQVLWCLGRFGELHLHFVFVPYFTESAPAPAPAPTPAVPAHAAAPAYCSWSWFPPPDASCVVSAIICQRSSRSHSRSLDRYLKGWGHVRSNSDVTWHTSDVCETCV